MSARVRSEQPKVAVGQIWEDADPRIKGRRVEVVEIVMRQGGSPLSVPEGLVSIRGTDRKGATRITKAKLSRFNGRRDGYRFVSDAAPNVPTPAEVTG